MLQSNTLAAIPEGPCYIYIYREREREREREKERERARDVRGVMVITVGNGYSDPNFMLEEAVCISHSANTLGEGMNPPILLPAMGR